MKKTMRDFEQQEGESYDNYTVFAPSKKAVKVRCSREIVCLTAGVSVRERLNMFS